MRLVTIQASAFKSTFEVLKDILNDVNIYFKPDGMYIVTLDTARTSLIDIYLAADNFEEYELRSRGDHSWYQHFKYFQTFEDDNQ